MLTAGQLRKDSPATFVKRAFWQLGIIPNSFRERTLPPQSNSLALLALPIYPSLGQMKILLRQPWRRRITMQRGSLARVNRKEGPAVWQFRWSEKDLYGTRVQRKRTIGTVERYQDEAAARTAVTVLLGELNSDKHRMGSHSITVAQLCDHFEQRELAKDNPWRSY